jgi:glutathione S-transferase
MTTNTMRENSLEIRRFINVPRDCVFAAWPRPEEIVKWFGPQNVTCLSATAEVQIGGAWHFRMQSDHAGETEHRGVYLVVKTPAKLVYTWTWKNHPILGAGETLVTVEFLELDGGTEIHLRHEGFANVNLRDRHDHDWNGCFDRLEHWLGESPSRRTMMQRG